MSKTKVYFWDKLVSHSESIIKVYISSLTSNFVKICNAFLLLNSKEF